MDEQEKWMEEEKEKIRTAIIKAKEQIIQGYRELDYLAECVCDFEDDEQDEIYDLLDQTREEIKEEE